MVWQFILSWMSYRLAMVRLPKDSTSGQGLVEYALILILISVAMIALMALVGPAISNMYMNIYENFSGAAG